MPATRRVIRKTEPRRRAPVEEQFWPVILSLFVLGGLLMGSVAVYLPRHGPQWFNSAATWLFAIPVGVCLLIWLLRYVNTYRVRRSLQLAAILCVLVHAVLFIVSMEATIFSRVSPEKQAAPKPAPRRAVVEPHYAPVQLASQDKRKRELFRPVQTRLPEPAHHQLASDQEQTQQPSTREQSLPTVESQPSADPQVVPREQTTETAPRQSDRASQLSRSLVAAPPKNVDPVAQPESSTADQARPVPTPQSQEPQRPAAVTTIQPRQVDAAPNRTETTAGAQLARSEPATRPRTEAAGAVSPSRPIADSRRGTPSEADLANLPTPQDRPATAQLAPRVPEVRQQALGGAQVERAARAPEAAATVVADIPRTEPRERETPAPGTEALAQPSRQTRSSVKESPPSQLSPTTAAVPTVTPPVTSRRDPGPAPPRTELARQTRGSPSATSRAGLQPAEIEQRPEPPGESRTARRTAVAPVPSLDPTAEPAAKPARSIAAGQIAASPVNAETPAASRTERGTARPPAEPGRWALAQSTTGSAGIGSAANLDRAMPAAASPATAASGSAHRKETTQTLPTGAALAPSESNPTPRSIAGGTAPGASIRATVPDTAVLPASEAPGELTTSSSAALARAESNAPPAAVTASEGTLDVDVGPTLTVDEAGRGRASGGGQPQLNPQTDAPVRARRPPGGRPQASISTLAEATEPVAPSAMGGGQPLAPSESPSLEFAAGESAQRRLPAGGLTASEPDATAGEPTAHWVDSSGGNPRRADLRSSAPGSPSVSATGDIASLPRRAPARPAAASDLAAQNLPDREAERSGDGSNEAAAAGETPSVAVSASDLEPSQAGGSTVGPVASFAGRTFEGRANDAPDPGRGRLERNAGPGTTPELALSSTGSGSRARRAADPLPIDTQAAEAEAPSPSDTAVAVADPATGRPPAAAEVGRLAEAEAAIRVDIADDLGPGGLGNEASISAGLSDRRSPRESFQISPRPSRFVRQNVGGLPDLNTTAAIPTPPYRRRTERTAGGPSEARSAAPSPQTEAAVESGLEFLARCQQARGNWTLQAFNEETTFVSDTAATALALLAFQGAGYTHREHRYASNVTAGLRFLIENQRQTGDLYLPMDEESNRSSWLYSHGIAALALCEAYGMTQDPALKEPAQRALDFVASSQDKTYGGWRYNPGSGADTSVTGWMMMALKSGELAGLEVPSGTYERARLWLDAAQQSEAQPHLYRYNPFAPNTSGQRHGRVASETMTAVGLLMRLYDGWRRDRQSMIQGAEYLQQNPPRHGTASSPERDTYYWYYGTQVMFHMGGQYWEQWNRHLHPLLVDTQIKQGSLAGSWDPRRPVPDRWGPQAGRLYVTAMNLLSLEVYYRHLPLYENTAR